jgi:hypothetical protein
MERVRSPYEHIRGVGHSLTEAFSKGASPALARAIISEISTRRKHSLTIAEPINAEGGENSVMEQEHISRVQLSGTTHSRDVVTVYFHNAASFMIIMRQSMGARFDQLQRRKREAFRGPSREIFCRISERLEKLPIRPPGRDRPDLVGYKYLRNKDPIGGMGRTHRDRGASVPSCRKPEQRVSTRARIKFKNDRPDSEGWSLNYPMRWASGSCWPCAAAAATKGTPPDGRRGQAAGVADVQCSLCAASAGQANCPSAVLCSALLLWGNE